MKKKNKSCENCVYKNCDECNSDSMIGFLIKTALISVIEVLAIILIIKNI